MIPGILTPPMLNRETGASYVGGEYDFLTSAAISGSGAEDDDLLIIFIPQGSNVPTLSSGNALTSFGSGGKYYYRVLNSADIAGTINLSGGGCGYGVWRGAATAAVVASDGPRSGTVTNQSVTGITKNASHAGLIGSLYTAGDAATLSIGSPPVWAQRASYDPSGTTSVDSYLIADRLQPVNPTYINASAFLWSSSDGGTLDIIELRT